MVCSHCGQAGHNYVRCPQLTAEQIKEIKEKKKKDQEEAARRRAQREERRARAIEKEKQLQAELSITRYEVINMTEHEVVLYSSYDGNTFQQFGYSAPKNSTSFTCSKKKIIIAAIPFVEVVDGDSVNAIRVIIPDPQTQELPYTCFFNMAMKDFDGTAIVFDKKYEPPKTELDQWKEYGLKSFYLLKQIEMMTGGTDEDGNVSKEEFENIAPFLDMIKDIKTPESCSEVDKEKAGVPSKLTNIT